MEKKLHGADGLPCPWNCFISNHLVVKGTDYESRGRTAGLGGQGGHLENGQRGVGGLERLLGPPARTRRAV